MKITKRQLQRIIKEEKQSLLDEIRGPQVPQGTPEMEILQEGIDALVELHGFAYTASILEKIAADLKTKRH